MLSDKKIARMTPEERGDLIRRLEKPIDEVVKPEHAQVIHKARFTFMIGGCIGLIPWIVYLAFTLPNTYVSHHWKLTWVGFDIFLVLLMALSAYLGYKRKFLFMLTAFATGLLLICDAWFDVTTAAPNDMWVSIVLAVLLELPLAALLIVGALRILRTVASRLWLLPPGKHVWDLELPV